MANLIKKSQELWRSLWAKIRATKWGKVGVVGLILLILGIVFRNKLEAGAVRVFDIWVQQPIGLVGLVAVGIFLLWAALWFAGLVVKVYRESQAVKKRNTVAAPKPLPLSWEEEHSIQFVRQAWDPFVRDAIHQAIMLADALMGHLRPTNRLAQLLWQPIAELKRYRDGMQDDVLTDRTYRHDVVMSALRKTMDQYLEVIRWINHCLDTYEVAAASLPRAEDFFPDWPAAHDQAVRELRNLSKRPENEGFKHYVNRYLNEVRFADQSGAAP
jgi:hypothetical protein